jgi:tetratricopeptide (TPR) repeat protein
VAHIRGRRERLLLYEEILNESVELWKRPGDGLAQAIRFVRGKMEKETGESRGRLMCLLGQYLLNDGLKSEAALCQSDALTLVNTPAARMEVLVSAINICIPFRRVSQGLRYVTEAEVLLGANHTDAAVVKWGAVLARNTGELLMRVGDCETALPYLRSAVEQFTNGGKEKETLRAKVDLAEATMLTGELDEALALCRNVRIDPLCEFVLFRLDVVQARTVARMGRVADAERLIDAAHKIAYDKFGDQQKYIARDLERAKAEVAYAKGDSAGAQTLEYCARRFAAAVGVAFD